MTHLITTIICLSIHRVTNFSVLIEILNRPHTDHDRISENMHTVLKKIN